MVLILELVSVLILELVSVLLFRLRLYNMLIEKLVLLSRLHHLPYFSSLGVSLPLLIHLVDMEKLEGSL
jgi:hypothetical protein